MLNSEEQIVTNLANQYFNLAKDDLKEEMFRDFQQKLQHHIQFLINNDFSRLIQVMYRIDIDEKDFNFVIHYADADKIAENLTNLIIKRLFEKAYFRLKYSSSND